MAKKVIFLDKDGTLIPDIPYNVDPSKIEFYPDVAAGLRSLAAYDFRFIIISNQSGISKGYFDEQDLKNVEHRLHELFEENGVQLDGFYYCPHDPHGRVIPFNETCSCRKPKPGLLLKAAREHGIDLDKSWMIGDILNDIEAGRKAGCRTILIDNGNETEWQVSEDRVPHYLLKNFQEAAATIIKENALDIMRLRNFEQSLRRSA